SFHGIALNVDMDLSPFGGINPCGYQSLPMTDARRLGVADLDRLKHAWPRHLIRHLVALGY
ncbi:MAG: octanoyltransferase, partial [Litorivicinus sp.]